MQFSQIVGHEHIKNHLIQSATAGRIPHAQLFVGPEGAGVLQTAIAYAQYVLCNNIGNENQGGNESCNLKFEHFSHPDLHFVYPTVTTDEVKTNQKASILLQIGENFLPKNPMEAFSTGTIFLM
ncbi:DNA polymerase III subunit delta' [Flavobacterium psychrophilum]|nr:DNA polymerase III subunit delta' [Flavobacterium psychrophilum]